MSGGTAGGTGRDSLQVLGRFFSSYNIRMHMHYILRYILNFVGGRALAIGMS